MGTIGPTLQSELLRARDALETVLRAVAAGGHACLHGEKGSGMDALLDRSATLFPRLGLRVVRATAIGLDELDVSELVRQIVQQWPPSVGGDDRLERAYLTLTAPGDGCAHVVLLVQCAEKLGANALRYLKLTCRCGPSLRIVLAGGPELKASMAGPEFGWLRDRLGCELGFSAPMPGPEPRKPLEAGNERVRGSRRRTGFGGGFAVAASVLFAVWPAREVGPSGPGTRLAARFPIALATSSVPGQSLPVAPEPAQDESPALAAAAIVETAMPALPESATRSEIPLAIAAAPVPAEAGGVSADVAWVPAPAGAEISNTSPASAEAHAQVATIGPPPAMAIAVQSVSVGVTRTALAAAASFERNGALAMQRCRTIVVKAQLGEDPSDADREFLRRGCQAERRGS